MKLNEKIKGIKFKGLSEFDFYYLLGQDSEFLYCNRLNITTWPLLKRVLARLLLENSNFEVVLQQGVNKLFVYNQKANRDDLYLPFLSLARLTKDSTLIKAKKTIKLKSLGNDIRLFVLIVCWIFQLSNRKLNLYEFLIVIECLEKSYELKKSLGSFVKDTHFNKCIVLYDSCFLDNFTVQFFKNIKCCTITLQHGVMLHSRTSLEKNIDFNGVEFRYSISDHFLVWNNFTRKEAIMAGVQSDKIHVAGPYKCIGVKKLSGAYVEKRIIGVLLDGEFTERYNHIMISIVNSYCELYGYKYILRYHPKFVGNEYKELCNMTFFAGISKEPLYDFANNVDFVLLSNSTAYFELAYLNYKVIRYCDNDDLSKFKDVKDVYFTDVISLANIVDNYDSISIKYREEIAIPDEVGERYVNILNNIC